MRNLSVTISPEIEERLASLAGQTGNSLDGCVQQAILEFLDGWEDYLKMVTLLQHGEARPQLSVR